MTYSLAAKFATEALSSFLAMYLGLGVVANDHLSRTKGGKHGFGFIAFGFGMAFAVPLMMFGFVSAHLNPAMCTALLVLGKIGWTEFAVASAGEYVGMFFGALAMWAHYWPHFDLAPGDEERPATAEEAEADSRKKLATFVTGPAVAVHWTHTVFVEFMCTTMLLVAALLMYSRHAQIADRGAYVVYRSSEGMWIGFMVFVMVLGLGGVTSIAANPARDLSPRLVHWIVPIRNKGASKWKYALVPFVATNVGGIAAGFLAKYALFPLVQFEL
jgi:glycerol uptake facilitator protein